MMQRFPHIHSSKKKVCASEWADIRISDYPNRIRLFLGLPSPMLCNQIYIRTYPYPTKYPTNIWLSRVDPQLSSKIEHMLHSSAELWANPGLDKFGNDFHWWFLGTFCLLKEFLKKKKFQKKIQNFGVLWIWNENEKKNSQFDSRYQNLPIRQNKC